MNITWKKIFIIYSKKFKLYWVKKTSLRFHQASGPNSSYALCGRKMSAVLLHSYAQTWEHTCTHVPSLSTSVCYIRLFLHSNNCSESSLQGITGVWVKGSLHWLFTISKLHWASRAFWQDLASFVLLPRLLILLANFWKRICLFILKYLCV